MENEKSEKSKDLPLVRIESYDHFTQSKIDVDDFDKRAAVKYTVYGEIIHENDLYYVVRSQFFSDESDEYGSMSIHWILKSCLITMHRYET